MTIATLSGIELYECREKFANADLGKAGFTVVPGGKGSHRKFRHPQYAGAVILSGKDGDGAHHYQEKQVRNAIREVIK